MELNGKVALVTGGASGLGRATVLRLAAQGARVGILDLDEAGGHALAGELGGRAIHLAVDISDAAAVEAAVEQVRQAFGALHICVNCAGMGGAGRTVGKKGPLPLENFRRIVDVNLVGTFNVLRVAAGKMVANEPTGRHGERGVIVNTASIAAWEGQMGQAGYAASKAGVVGLTLPVSRDLAAYGIRVCAIAPGLFETPMIAGIPPEVKAQIVSQLEFPKRPGDPDEFAALVQHIVENAYLNGEVIRLDGGTRPPPR